MYKIFNQPMITLTGKMTKKYNHIRKKFKEKSFVVNVSTSTLIITNFLLNSSISFDSANFGLRAEKVESKIQD